MSDTGGPTLDGFTAFLRQVATIGLDVLPANSPFIPMAFEVALALCNEALALASPLMYRLAVYNLGTHNIVNFAPDVGDKTYFKEIREAYNILKFAAGVVASTTDVSTTVSLEVIEAAKGFTMANLQQCKDPWGRQYIAIAQSYGPTIWGLTS